MFENDNMCSINHLFLSKHDVFRHFKIIMIDENEFFDRLNYVDLTIYCHQKFHNSRDSQRFHCFNEYEYNCLCVNVLFQLTKK